MDPEPDPKVFIFDDMKRKSGIVASPPSASSTGCFSPPSDGVRVFRLDQTKFTYRDIVAATENFSNDLVVGRGGFGVVYRGVLPDGRHVAIKKLARLGGGGGEGDGEREFRAEMEVLANRIGFGWPHPHLVTLYGWCLFGTSKLLVYEYLEGGNLEDVIASWGEFGWHKRLETAVGVARALVFLHHECQPAVVHRDVKASNVLLDKEGRAKVTDFGLARTVEPGDSHVSTIVAGTVGYVAPEYSQTWRATTKGDVYSYGVLVMELATGRKAVDGGEECLVEWARRMARDGWSVVEQQGQDRGLLVRLLMLGMRCTTELPQDRPDMREVLATLLNIIGSTINYGDCSEKNFGNRGMHYRL